MPRDADNAAGSNSRQNKITHVNRHFFAGKMIYRK